MRVLEPMFAVEAKKRMLKGVKDPVANLRQGNQAKASDQAADVVSASAVTLGTTLFPSEYCH